ncbi:hypothetical protein C0J52_25434 [Blattella germanica]|nr:hypothetical protein C0J52_25435 [Blattella germanica]PSN35617.1 hypothetical protein C0J52_25434 [Blattella germanica]
MVRHIGQQNGDLEVKFLPGICTEEVRRQIERQEAQEKTYPNVNIVMNGIVRRRDVHWWRIGRIYEAFDWVADCVGVKFVDPNSWISDGSLGRDGVHLNRRGASELGVLFSRESASKTKEAVKTAAVAQVA